MHTVTFASHLAYLDSLTGEGLLVRPRPEDDVPDPLGGASLQAVEWDAVVRELDRLGWEPSEDDDGLPFVVGITRQGREVVALYGREPVTSEPTIHEQAEALSHLSALADLP